MTPFGRGTSRAHRARESPSSAGIASCWSFGAASATGPTPRRQQNDEKQNDRRTRDVAHSKLLPQRFGSPSSHPIRQMRTASGVESAGQESGALTRATVGSYRAADRTQPRRHRDLDARSRGRRPRLRAHRARAGAARRTGAALRVPERADPAHDHQQRLHDARLVRHHRPRPPVAPG